MSFITSAQKPDPRMDNATTLRQLREANERLRREVGAHEATLQDLETVRLDLELCVADRTKELSLVKSRFETALRGAKVHVFSQDRDLRYTWAYVPERPQSGAEMLGRTDEDFLPAADRESVMALKRGVLATGEPADCEVSYLLPECRVLVSLHIEPTRGPDGAIDGITCAAVDISRTRTLETEQRKLAEQLGTAVQRYETALRGSNVTVFTQDQDLVYTSVSKEFLGHGVTDLIGRSDNEILPDSSREAIVAMKRDAMAVGQARSSENRISTAETQRWLEFHVEPLRNLTGQTVGLTGAAVDVTDRKDGEAHLRMLMRELTHRSKNLLAVIQAMARQTARHSGTIDGFLEHFGARLQALAASHDLLVQESWHGASLHDLVRSQLGHHIDDKRSQVVADGPPVLLKPEAAQSLGLALHELSTNAAKYGALSTPNGRVTIVWTRLPADDGYGIEINWKESDGPSVSLPSHRGFGSMVIERNLARSLDARVELDFASTGLTCHIVVPVTQFVPAR